MGDKRNLKNTFKMTRDDNSLFKAPEQPNDKITVRILLSVLLDLQVLNIRLSPNNLEASRDVMNRNAIVVQGIRPNHGYGAQDILRKVQESDREARII